MNEEERKLKAGLYFGARASIPDRSPFSRETNQEMEQSMSIIRLVIAIIGAFGIGSLLVTKYRMREERRKEHFKNIKERVFEPLLFRIKYYYLSILQRKSMNIGIETKPKGDDPKRLFREDFKTGFTTTLKIVEPEEYLRKKTQDSKIDTQLYSCVKKNHFSEFVTEWEEFLCQFKTYSNCCCEKIKELAEQLKSRIGMSSYERSDQLGGNEHWICEDDLALFVFQRLIGTELRDGLMAEKRGNVTELRGQRVTYAQGDNQEIENIKKTIKELAEDHSKIIALVEKAEHLKNWGTKLKEDIETLILSNKLSGRCSFM